MGVSRGFARRERVSVILAIQGYLARKTPPPSAAPTVGLSYGPTNSRPIIFEAGLSYTSQGPWVGTRCVSCAASGLCILEVLEVLRAPNIGGHRKLFCRKAMLPFGSHQAPLYRGSRHVSDMFERCFGASARQDSVQITSSAFKAI